MTDHNVQAESTQSTGPLRSTEATMRSTVLVTSLYWTCPLFSKTAISWQAALQVVDDVTYLAANCHVWSQNPCEGDVLVKHRSATLEKITVSFDYLLVTTNDTPC